MRHFRSQCDEAAGENRTYRGATADKRGTALDQGEHHHHGAAAGYEVHDRGADREAKTIRSHQHFYDSRGQGGNAKAC